MAYPRPVRQAFSKLGFLSQVSCRDVSIRRQRLEACVVDTVDGFL